MLTLLGDQWHLALDTKTFPVKSARWWPKPGGFGHQDTFQQLKMCKRNIYVNLSLDEFLHGVSNVRSLWSPTCRLQKRVFSDQSQGSFKKVSVQSFQKKSISSCSFSSIGCHAKAFALALLFAFTAAFAAAFGVPDALLIAVVATCNASPQGTPWAHDMAAASKIMLFLARSKYSREFLRSSLPRTILASHKIIPSCSIFSDMLCSEEHKCSLIWIPHRKICHFQTNNLIEEKFGTHGGIEKVSVLNTWDGRLWRYPSNFDTETLQLIWFGLIAANKVKPSQRRACCNGISKATPGNDVANNDNGYYENIKLWTQTMNLVSEREWHLNWIFHDRPFARLTPPRS